MPIINVKLIEDVFTPDQKREIIERLTDAMVSIEGENLRPVTWVVVEEVASGDMGVGGKPLSTSDHGWRRDREVLGRERAGGRARAMCRRSVAERRQRRRSSPSRPSVRRLGLRRRVDWSRRSQELDRLRGRSTNRRRCGRAA